MTGGLGGEADPKVVIHSRILHRATQTCGRNPYLRDVVLAHVIDTMRVRCWESA